MLKSIVYCFHISIATTLTKRTQYFDITLEFQCLNIPYNIILMTIISYCNAIDVIYVG